MSICIEIPVQTTAGLSFSASVTDALHPAPDWALALHMRGPSQIDLTVAPDGKITAPAADTAAWAPGRYWWSIRATRGADIVEVQRGDLTVAADPLAQGPGYDGRSENEKALAAIEAVLAKRATIDQDRYTINNRELWRTPVPDLLKLRNHYADAVAKERRKASGRRGWGRAIRMEFS